MSIKKYRSYCISYLEDTQKAGANESINPNDLTLHFGYALLQYIDVLVQKIKELRNELPFPKIHIRYGICLGPNE